MDINFLYNKKDVSYPDGTTVRDLLNEKGIKKAAVWINGEQLLKAEYDTRVIREGDVVRLLRAMGGG